MFRKILGALGLGLAAVIGLFFVSSHHVSEVAGYFRATADETVDNLTGQLPVEVRDRKLQNELRVARQELVDRQAALNLSRNHLDKLQQEIASLEVSLAGREHLLADAYPVLRQATERQEERIRFASSEFTLLEFQQEIDDLLAQQERQTMQLEIKRQGLGGIEASLREGEKAVVEMRHALDRIEQEVATLRTRRSQAELESSTLDLITSTAASQHSASVAISESVDRMKQQIESLEARNEARRTLKPAGENSENALAQAWSRLDTLKSFHERSTDPATTQTVPSHKEEAAARRRSRSE